MHNHLGKITLLMTIINFETLKLAAQSSANAWEIGGGIGIVVYQGDLAPSAAGSFRTLFFAGNLHAAKILNRSFSLRANLAFGKLRGDDAVYNHPEYRQQRNFNFSSPVVEASALLVWNPFGANYSDKGLSPYLFGGAGAGFLSVKRDWSRFNMAYFGDGSDVVTGLNTDAAHATPKIIPVIPVGAGMRYNLSSRLAVNVEVSYRLAFTDYIDGFSQSANPSRYDHYHTTTAGIVYRIGIKDRLNCPVVRY